MMICWFNECHLKLGGKYFIRANTNEAECIVKSINYKLDINTLDKNTSETATIEMNDIAEISIKTSNPLFFDPYKKNNITGSLIFIDENTNETVAAGMIT